MNRYYSINEAIGNKTIELYSELEPGKKYSIEGSEYTYNGVQEGQHAFSTEDGSPYTLSQADLEQLINAGDVKAVQSGSIEDTVPQFRTLDRFTKNTFNVPTDQIWERSGVREHFNETDLYTIDSLCQRLGLAEMPLPGEGKYEEIINDEHWPTLKRYLTLISPDIELPEELG